MKGTVMKGTVMKGTVMKERLLLTAGGVDKKGVVFNLTKLLKKYDFNIEDSSMILLRGTFSMIMLLSHDLKYSKSEFKKAVTEYKKKFKMTVDISKISESNMKEYKPLGTTYLITISGADKAGIVSAMTEIIYKNGGNIIGLETKSSETVKPHAYYMFLEVDIPKGKKAKPIESQLKAEGKKIGVHVGMQKVDNQIL